MSGFDLFIAGAGLWLVVLGVLVIAGVGWCLVAGGLWLLVLQWLAVDSPGPPQG